MDALIIVAPVKQNVNDKTKATEATAKKEDELKTDRKSFVRQLLAYGIDDVEETDDIAEHAPLTEIPVQSFIESDEDTNEETMFVSLQQQAVLVEPIDDTGSKQAEQAQQVIRADALLPSSKQPATHDELVSKLHSARIAAAEPHADSSDAWVLGQSARGVKAASMLDLTKATPTRSVLSNVTTDVSMAWTDEHKRLIPTDESPVLTQPAVVSKREANQHRHATDLFAFVDIEEAVSADDLSNVIDDFVVRNIELEGETDQLVDISHLTDEPEPVSSVKNPQLHDDIHDKVVSHKAVHADGERLPNAASSAQTMTEDEIEQNDIKQVQTERPQHTARKPLVHVTNNDNIASGAESTEQLHGETRQSVTRGPVALSGTNASSQQWSKDVSLTTHTLDQHMGNDAQQEGHTDAHAHFQTDAAPETNRISAQGTSQTNAALPFAEHLAAETVVEAEPQALGTLIRSIAVEQVEQTQTVRVALHPRHLGELELQVALEQGTLSAHIIAESESTRRVIEAALPQLRDVLADQGVQMETITVSVHTEGNTSLGTAPDGFHEQYEQSEFAMNASYHESPLEDDTVSGTASRQSMTMIDVLA